MDSSLFRAPLARIILGAVNIVGIVAFAGVWFATLVLSGFSLNGDTFAGWTYFPLFWPHLAATTLGFMIFLRYGANWPTALTILFMWGVAVFSDLFGAILYWRLGWLCNITGKNKLTGLEVEICNSENALLITLWVLSTILLVVAIAGFLAHLFDLYQAGRSSSGTPATKFSMPLAMLGVSGIGSLLIFFGLWIASLITSGLSISGSQTFGVWTYTNIFLLQMAGATLGVMLFLRYGANTVTGVAAIVLWSLSVFAAIYGTFLYWRLGWFCLVLKNSTLTGVDLIICNNEESYLIAVWILVSFLWLLSIMGAVAHIWDFVDIRKLSQSINPLRKTTRDVDEEGVVPPQGRGSTPGDQYGTWGGRQFVGAVRAVSRSRMPVLWHTLPGKKRSSHYRRRGLKD